MEDEGPPLDLRAEPALQPRRPLEADVAEGSYVVAPDGDPRGPVGALNRHWLPVLLPIPLDGVGVTHLGLVRVLPELLTRASLPQQIPAAIQLYLHGAQPLAIRLQPRLVGAVGLLTMPDLMLLGDEALDLGRDALIVHAPILDPAPCVVARGAYTIRSVSRWDAFVDEIANELRTWPGVRIELQPDDVLQVKYETSELGQLYRDPGVAELPVLEAEHDELLEHGDAEPAELTPESSGVSHTIHGPSDVTATLELFDRRYRDVRGEDDPYSSEDPS